MFNFGQKVKVKKLTKEEHFKIYRSENYDLYLEWCKESINKQGIILKQYNDSNLVKVKIDEDETVFYKDELELI
jgi:hypothetical protein